MFPNQVHSSGFSLKYCHVEFHKYIKTGKKGMKNSVLQFTNHPPHHQKHNNKTPFPHLSDSPHQIAILKLDRIPLSFLPSRYAASAGLACANEPLLTTPARALLDVWVWLILEET